MLISDYDFELPPELIAQEPLERRESSRMLAVDRRDQSISDRQFVDLPRLLGPGDLLVLNDTRVFPARLLGQTPTGANIELFLVREIGNGSWETLAKPARRLRVGKSVIFDVRLSAEVIEKTDDGRVVVRFESRGDLYQLIDELGRTPLPPYIRRERSMSWDGDRERYQTVFAKKRGAVAAPTAGLHFTTQILGTIRSAGVETAEITLHVGYGTFEPVRVNDLSQHTVSPESYEIDVSTAQRLNRAKDEGRRIVAVGTTTTRALETNFMRNGLFAAGSHLADLTITPGYQFKAIDALLTNFHLPRSSLLVLTSTFGGRELIMSAYRHAVSAGYRFYSYGDCMLIV
jgi:S-adenosylmethionine:tRNA ribosyltransferase-isomerase